jgi:hypothetical protein
MKSFAFRLSYGVLGPATGWLVDTYGLSATFGIFGCIVTLLLGTLMVPLCRRVHELHVEYIPVD